MVDKKHILWPSSSVVVTLIIVVVCVAAEFIRVEILLKEHVTRIQDLESRLQTNRPQHDESIIKVNADGKPDTPRIRIRRTASSDPSNLYLHNICNVTIIDRKCRAGPPGPPGRPGLKGRRGKRGSKGDMGMPGMIGEKGIMGSPGRDGMKGVKGMPGKQGLRGWTGRDGLQGFKGEPGSPGIMGSPGRDGMKGVKGMPGKQGIRGWPGINGREGRKGEKGEMGMNGKPGPRGLPGSKGDAGLQGSKGDAGLSVPSPHIAVQPSSMVIIAGQTAVFHCTACGNPEPKFTWSKVGKSPQLSGSHKLVIANVTSSDAGLYQCQAKTLTGTERKTVNLTVTHFVDCSEIYKSGERRNGVYTVDPDGHGPFQVYCDMTTDGGGWTVFQRRIENSLDFKRNWNQYKTGFGKLKGEFWLGNEKIHRLTSRTASSLRVDAENEQGVKAYAKYGNFSVGPEVSNYRLIVNLYSGTAGDALNYHDGMAFTTYDNDNDMTSFWVQPNCANRHQSGWWYKNCYRMNLNNNIQGSWVSFAGATGSVWLKSTNMMLRPQEKGH